MQKSTLSAALLAVGALACALPAQAQSWTGPYVGGHIGYSFLSEDDSESLSFDTNLDGTYSENVNTTGGANAFSPGFCGGTANGNNAAAGCGEDDNGAFEGGVRAGYDWNFGGTLVGVVGEYSFSNVEDSVTGFSTTPAAYTFTRELKSIAALRGRVGYEFNNTLLYATAGYAWADVDHSFSTTNTANSFTPRGGDDTNGYQIGAGAERMFGERWSFGAEYLFTSLDDDDYTVRVGPGTAPVTNPFRVVNTNGTDMQRSNDKFELHAIRATVAYRFGQ